jgi:hypothetical protein
MSKSLFLILYTLSILFKTLILPHKISFPPFPSSQIWMKYLVKVQVGPTCYVCEISVETHGQSVKWHIPESLYKNRELVYSVVLIGFIDTEDYYQNVNFHILVITRKPPKMF